MIGHLIGDFYLQSNKMVEQKKKSLKILLWHCIIYILPILFMGLATITKSEIISFLKFLISVILLHGFIDFGKSVIEKKNNFKHKYIFFLADQILHVATLYILIGVFDLEGGKYINFFKYSYEISSYDIFIKAVIMALICAKPASIFIAAVFEEISTAANESDSQKKAKIGSLIGILEREMILILGLMGQFGAIGYVLAAKSLARFKQLEERDFAEKYIVGTLLSAIIAILSIVIYKYAP
jgi:hypothetical protein